MGIILKVVEIVKILLQTIGMARDRPAPYGKGERFIWRGTGPRPTVRGRDLSSAGQARALRCGGRDLSGARRYPAETAFSKTS